MLLGMLVHSVIPDIRRLTQRMGSLRSDWAA